MTELTEAANIQEGCWFIKRMGSQAYLRISESAVKFNGLDSGFIWGVCYNGNMARVSKTTKVRRASYADYLNDINALAETETKLGCKELSNYGL